MAYRSRRSVRLLLFAALLLGSASLALPALPVGATSATWTVNSLGDSGTATCAANAGAGGATCQLRDALAKAADGDTIAFSVTGTIGISAHGTLTVVHSVTIQGPTSGAGVTVDGGHAVRVIHLGSGIVASMSNLTIANGSTNVSGGGIFNDGTLTVTNCTFSGNNSSSDGGGIYSQGGTVTVTNSTFSGNSAANTAGGISNHGTLTVTNSTFSGNTATFFAGIFNGNTLNLTNTIVSGNTGDTLGGIAPATNSHNFVGGTALLDTLGSYGGPTQTMPPLPGSPAIDTGDDTACAATGPGAVGGVDQRGVARTAHGPHCDIGAAESQGFLVSVVSGNNQTATVNAAFAAPLIVAVLSTFGEPVAGGQVIFTGPASGAGIQSSPLTAPINAGSVASVTPTANGTAGSYAITASASGATPATLSFSLANAPLVSGLHLPAGPTSGGAAVTIFGSAFAAGSTVAFGGVAATNVVVVNGTTITATTPAHGTGTVDVAVTTNGVTGTLTNGYTYGTITALPAPQPANAAGSPAPNALPSTRPTNSTSGNPNSLPAPRP